MEATDELGEVAEVSHLLRLHVKCVWLIKGYCQLLKLKISVHPIKRCTTLDDLRSWIRNEGKSHKKLWQSLNTNIISHHLFCFPRNTSKRKNVPFLLSWHRVHLFNVTKQASFAEKDELHFIILLLFDLAAERKEVKSQSTLFAFLFTWIFQGIKNVVVCGISLKVYWRVELKDWSDPERRGLVKFR